jgi:hypothetical protein
MTPLLSHRVRHRLEQLATRFVRAIPGLPDSERQVHAKALYSVLLGVYLRAIRDKKPEEE